MKENKEKHDYKLSFAYFQKVISHKQKHGIWSWRKPLYSRDYHMTLTLILMFGLILSILSNRLSTVWHLAAGQRLMLWTLLTTSYGILTQTQSMRSGSYWPDQEREVPGNLVRRSLLGPNVQVGQLQYVNIEELGFNVLILWLETLPCQ